jgi:lipoyl-dependent peroxiredoxin
MLAPALSGTETTEREEPHMRSVTSAATIVWVGNVARGEGHISGESGAFSDVPIDLPTRIGEGTGGKATPEELLAAAHVACLTMSIGTALARARTPAERIEATSRVTLDMSGDRPQIPLIEVEVRGTVPGIDEAAFAEAVREAEQGCLISRVVSQGNVRVEATPSLSA